MRRVSNMISMSKVSNVRFATGVWSDVKMGPADPILGLSVAFQEDTDSRKINLGVGAYRTNESKPFVLPAVREAEKRIFEKKTFMEYAPIGGTAQYTNLAQNLLFNPSFVDPEAENIDVSEKTTSMQTLSGTGSLRLAGEWLSKFYPGNKEIIMPNPTWANHNPIFADSNLAKSTYNYYNPENCGLNFEGMVQDLDQAQNGSIVLLHACAHNPTGVDPSQDQWRQIVQLVKQKGHYPLVDCAYQGFASGDLLADAFAVREFYKEIDTGFIVCQSFAKNLGLYGQRAGGMHVVCADEEERNRVTSQLKILIRPMYSSPPIHGANLVTEVLSDVSLRQQWFSEVKGMADRIIDMRQLLSDALVKAGSAKDWAHVNNQIGMFCYTGLSAEQCERLISEYHIYLTKNGRISMAGVTSDNVEYLANAMHEVSK